MIDLATDLAGISLRNPVLAASGTFGYGLELEPFFDLRRIGGFVAKSLAVETAPLPSAKTRLKVFDMKGLECGGVGRVLLNAVMSCADASGEIADCQADVSTSSRGSVSFIK